MLEFVVVQHSWRAILNPKSVRSRADKGTLMRYTWEPRVNFHKIPLFRQVLILRAAAVDPSRRHC